MATCIQPGAGASSLSEEDSPALPVHGVGHGFLFCISPIFPDMDPRRHSGYGVYMFSLSLTKRVPSYLSIAVVLPMNELCLMDI